MQVIYLDSLFLLNTLADYLLCLCTGRICGLVLRRWRYLAAAVFGGLYAAAVWLPGLRFLDLPAARLGSGLIMGLIAFSGESHPLRCALVLLPVGAAFGGTLWAVSLAGGGGVTLSLRTLGLSFGICWGLLSLLLRAKKLMTERKRVRVRVRFLGRETEFFALVDTGNSLSDPVTGRHVLVAGNRALRPLFREDSVLFEQLPPVELLEALGQTALAGRFRLLPYSNLSGSGLLPVFRPDGLQIDGKENTDILLAVSPNAAGDGFEGIL